MQQNIAILIIFAVITIINVLVIMYGKIKKQIEDLKWYIDNQHDKNEEISILLNKISNRLSTAVIISQKTNNPNNDSNIVLLKKEAGKECFEEVKNEN